jgi:hypothetical protein
VRPKVLALAAQPGWVTVTGVPQLVGAWACLICSELDGCLSVGVRACARELMLFWSAPQSAHLLRNSSSKREPDQGLRPRCKDRTRRLGWLAWLDGLDGKWIQAGPAVNELVALVGFGFVGSVSPGPNDAVLWASGCGWGSAERSHPSWARPWGSPCERSPRRLGSGRAAGEVVLTVVGSVPLLSGLPGRREEWRIPLRR